MKTDHDIYKDEGAGNSTLIKIYPNCAMVFELKDGYTAELRWHSGIRKDSSVLHSGHLKKKDDIWWVEEEPRFKLV